MLNNKGWHLSKIPKTLHLYFGGNKIPYLRYLTIESFHFLNPDWKIKFYFPRFPNKSITWDSKEQEYTFSGTDFFNCIAKLGVEIIPVDFEDYGISNNLPEVHKSNYLTFNLLSSEGGYWADMDILFFRPMADVDFNRKANSDTDTIVCISKYGHSVGLVAGSKDNSFFADLLIKSMRCYDKRNYQCITSHLYNIHYPTLKSIQSKLNLHPLNLSMSTIYPYDADQIHEIFDFSKHVNRIEKGTIGIHWFGGAKCAGEFMKKTDGGYLPVKDNIIGLTILNHIVNHGRTFK